MTTEDRRKKIDNLISNLDKYDATDKKTMKETNSSNMQEAKEKIAMSEMASVGASPNILRNVQRGGKSYLPLVVHEAHNARPHRFE